MTCTGIPSVHWLIRSSLTIDRCKDFQHGTKCLGMIGNAQRGVSRQINLNCIGCRNLNRHERRFTGRFPQFPASHAVRVDANTLEAAELCDRQVARDKLLKPHRPPPTAHRSPLTALPNTVVVASKLLQRNPKPARAVNMKFVVRLRFEPIARLAIPLQA